MTPTLLLRGMLVGLAAGVLAFVVARLLGEGPLGLGIAFEQASPAAAGGVDPTVELVSRSVQSTLGLAVGTIVFAIALGGLYGLVYALTQGRLGALSARATAVVVALGGFVALHVLPALKYPSNPPGTSDSDTIGYRTQWYVALLAISVGVVVGGVVLARYFAPRFGPWNSALLAVGTGLAVMVIAYLVLPSVDETPAGFAGDTLWRFRVATSAIQLTLWTTLGLGFGALTERSLRASAPARVADRV
jgi:hypothetical protein